MSVILAPNSIGVDAALRQTVALLLSGAMADAVIVPTGIGPPARKEIVVIDQRGHMVTGPPAHRVNGRIATVPPMPLAAKIATKIGLLGHQPNSATPANVRRANTRRVLLIHVQPILAQTVRAARMAINHAHNRAATAHAANVQAVIRPSPVESANNAALTVVVMVAGAVMQIAKAVAESNEPIA